MSAFFFFSYRLASLPLFHTPLSDVTMRCRALSVLLGLRKALLQTDSRWVRQSETLKLAAAPRAAQRPPAAAAAHPLPPSPLLSRDLGMGGAWEVIDGRATLHRRHCVAGRGGGLSSAVCGSGPVSPADLQCLCREGRARESEYEPYSLEEGRVSPCGPALAPCLGLGPGARGNHFVSRLAWLLPPSLCGRS